MAHVIMITIMIMILLNAGPAVHGAAKQPDVQVLMESTQINFGKGETIPLVLKNGKAESIVGHLAIEAYFPNKGSWVEVAPDVCGKFGYKAICLQPLKSLETKSL